MRYKNKGITAIGILIIIVLLVVLVWLLFSVINPRERAALKRDGIRERWVGEVQSAVSKYYEDNGFYPAENIPDFYSTGVGEICNTNIDGINCGDLVDLSLLVREEYLVEVPTDPNGSNASNGTGYYIGKEPVVVRAKKSEIKPIIIAGISEEQYLGDARGESTIITTPPLVGDITPLSAVVTATEGDEVRISGSGWHSSPHKFDNLEPKREYSAQSRIAGSEELLPSPPSPEVRFSTPLLEYTLEYKTGNCQSVSGDTIQNIEHMGIGGEVTAVPQKGSVFVEWSDGAKGATRRGVDVVKSDVFTAQCNSINYTLSYSFDAGGSIKGDIIQEVPRGGSGKSVTAVANNGYVFVEWSDGVKSATRTDNNINTGIDVRATFSAKDFIINYDGNGGLCSPDKQRLSWLASTEAPNCTKRGHALSGFTILDGECPGFFNTNTGQCSSIGGDMVIGANWREPLDACDEQTSVNYKGKDYNIVPIGDQCWFKENLSYTETGCLDKSWNSGLACREHLVGDKTEVLYQLAAAVEAGCPLDWRIPTDGDWYKVESFLNFNGNSCDLTRTSIWSCNPAGYALKSTSFQGSDISGFSGKPSLARLKDESLFTKANYATYWSSTTSTGGAQTRFLEDERSTVLRHLSNLKSGHSVRCVRD